MYYLPDRPGGLPDLPGTCRDQPGPARDWSESGRDQGPSRSKATTEQSYYGAKVLHVQDGLVRVGKRPEKGRIGDGRGREATARPDTLSASPLDPRKPLDSLTGPKPEKSAKNGGWVDPISRPRAMPV